MEDPPFKIPPTIAQDISLILELVVPSVPVVAAITEPNKTEETSSDEEQEVIANVLLANDSSPDPSDASDSDSDSSFARPLSYKPKNNMTLPCPNKPSQPASLSSDDDGEDEDGGGQSSSMVVFATKNEIIAPNVTLPSITEIRQEEEIEEIGEIMSIVDSVVVVRSHTHGMTRVLDTDSLLVFDNRQVLGLVFETFGPLTRPLYSIRFPAASSIDTELVTVGRPVYHSPERSSFAFTSDIRQYKGSDASNLFDEEVGEDEQEFSDDEKEQEYRRKHGGNKRRRQDSVSRGSVGSRYQTPIPQEIGSESMDGDLPYDIQVLPYLDRPPPSPYEDVGLETHGEPIVIEEAEQQPSVRIPGNTRGKAQRSQEGVKNGRDRGRRKRDRGDRGRRGAGWGAYSSGAPRHEQPYINDTLRELSPTSFAIARVTGQLEQDFFPQQYNVPQNSQYSPHQPYNFSPSLYDPVMHAGDFTFHQNMPYPQFQTVAPHINPRFATSFGFGQQFLSQPQWNTSWGQGEYRHSTWVGPPHVSSSSTSEGTRVDLLPNTPSTEGTEPPPAN